MLVSCARVCAIGRDVVAMVARDCRGAAKSCQRVVRDMDTGVRVGL